MVVWNLNVFDCGAKSVVLKSHVVFLDSDDSGHSEGGIGVNEDENVVEKVVGFVLVEKGGGYVPLATRIQKLRGRLVYFTKPTLAANARRYIIPGAERSRDFLESLRVREGRVFAIPSKAVNGGNSEISKGIGCT